MLLGGCQAKPSAKPATAPTPLVTSCLGDFQIDDLEGMMGGCDEAIEQTPDQADLHRDRALLLTLLGHQARACDDVEVALSLLNRSSQPVDPMMLHELKVRQTICKQSRTMAGRD